MARWGAIAGYRDERLVKLGSDAKYNTMSLVMLFHLATQVSGPIDVSAAVEERAKRPSIEQMIREAKSCFYRKKGCSTFNMNGQV
jgi:hypothetical protein